MISIKQYAEERGKSIQAVHQQRKRKKYKARLEGHVIEKDGVYYLDKEAVKILDSAHETTVQVVDTNTKAKIEKMEHTIENLRNRENNLLNDLNKKNTEIINLQSKIQQQTEQIAALLVENKEKTLLLEQYKGQNATQNNPQSDSESRKKGFFARLFGK
ncbi:Uncharacterised protein [Faecalicoccus pleomorphus]|uniref:DUF536 domain-containing protein n=1 Tax=Faecalicoccus pleomorphus TaxID=1323 RepID=A0A380L6E7_9FIRM|nr:hypothetical protein [Faecalicoccus pleomorphus]SUN83209.1 Uncharacterised protein [Faecalicoccus pleomorphus]SUN83215.1 Uncharacterised protein [Faecalicoccus pleomorphus]SUO38353.1 Uncharacterised protein [Faecalicoccus pleomorphus]